MYNLEDPLLNNNQRHELWQKILTDFDNSGLSKSEFSRINGIKADNLYYHINKRRKKQQDNFVPAVLPVNNIEQTYNLRWHSFELSLPLNFNPIKVSTLIKLLAESKLC